MTVGFGDDTLRTIARELVATVRANVTIDWTVRENVRAQLRVLVKRILRKYGYPPDLQERATLTVLEQARGAFGRLGSGLTSGIRGEFCQSRHAGSKTNQAKT
jgi:hypothetical protein